MTSILGRLRTLAANASLPPVWYRQSREDRHWIAITVVAIAAMLLGCTASVVWQLQVSEQTQDALAQGRQRLDQERLRPPPTTRSDLTWLDRLPANDEVVRTRISARALALASASNVTLSELSFEDSGLPSDAPFSIITVNARAVGGYADTKLWLRAMLSEWPNALAVLSVTMRTGTNNSLETSFNLRLYTRKK